jgi:glycerol-3-phosphate dehydrogenase
VHCLFDHDRAYIFQNADGRIIFAIPYQGDFTLIGTTDHHFRGEPGAVTVQPPEITYLCNAASEYFREAVSPEQVVRTFAGVRSLYDERAAKPKDLSRDYVVKLDADRHQAPLISIYGGKITTARRLAEATVARLTPFFQLPPPWTHRVPLPGGDFPPDAIAALVGRARGLWPFLSKEHALRLVRAYGTRLDRIFGHARRAEDLGQNFGGGLTAAEVSYLMREEFAETSEDILWRRSKLGLHLRADDQARLARFIGGERQTHAAAE